MTIRSLIASLLCPAVLLAAAPGPPHAENVDPAVAARFINALGIDLLASTPPDSNALFSPYSIQTALAMTWAGADGETRREMASVLHYPAGDVEAHASLAELKKALDRIAAATATTAASQGGDPVTFVVANRLFGQSGYPFRESFTTFIKEQYDAPLQLMDFRNNSEHARGEINAWVEDQTRQRIRDVIPPGGLDEQTRLVLVNAIYLKAPWLYPFAGTQRLGFHTAAGALLGVPTMRREADFGYVKRDDYSVITIPYIGIGLQLLILLPDSADGLRALEQKLTPELLATEATAAVPTDVSLELPKFKLTPPVMSLGDALQSLGMKSAFDVPRGSADFDRMAPHRPDRYLCISAVFHKAFLGIDEKGTEASAATATVMQEITSASHLNPIEVRVDRPFILAIQQRPTGACLFLGRVTDPR